MAYQSLEDRIVKAGFAAATASRTPAGLPVELPGHEAEFTHLTRGAERADGDEVDRNPRSAPARLRAVERSRRGRWNEGRAQAGTAEVWCHRGGQPTRTTPARSGIREGRARDRQRPATRGTAGSRPGPQTAPMPRPVDRPARLKTASQAKARAKARKAKGAQGYLAAARATDPQALRCRPAAADPAGQDPVRRPGDGLTGRRPGHHAVVVHRMRPSGRTSSPVRALNDALMQQKEALERDVLEAESAPALADAARNLGMIPSRDTAHLVRDPPATGWSSASPSLAEGAPLRRSTTSCRREAARPRGSAPRPQTGRTCRSPADRRTAPAPGSTEVPVVLPPPP